MKFKPEKQFEKEFWRILDPYPVLDTPRLRLRHVFRADAAELTQATSDPTVTKYEPWGPYDETETAELIENILSQMKNGLCAEWAIERKDDAAVLGLIHLNKIDFFHRSAELGYWIRRKAWNRGYTTEAVKVLIDYAVNTLRLDEVTAVCHPQNSASLRVLEKAGMKYLRTLEDHIAIRGRSVDCLQYHVTRWDLL